MQNFSNTLDDENSTKIDRKRAQRFIKNWSSYTYKKLAHLWLRVKLFLISATR